MAPRSRVGCELSRDSNVRRRGVHTDRGRQRGDGAQRRQGDRGADPQTLRGLPAARRADHHFVNKLDREGRDPFDLLDEIKQALALDVTPASWPIGMGRDFLGTYDLFADAPLLLFERRLCG
jgi:hypothetical protein